MVVDVVESVSEVFILRLKRWDSVAEL